MSIESQFKDTINQIEKIKERINELEENDDVKEYRSKCELLEDLTAVKQGLYEQLKKERYKECNHIWVISQTDYDRHEGRTHRYYGCAKCGLDERVYYLLDQGLRLEELTPKQKIMYDFMYNNSQYRGGLLSKYECDLSLAKAICKKIIEAYPNIDNDTLRKYFEIALDNIRNIKVSEERKVSRAKRLSLEPNFDNWN